MDSHSQAGIITGPTNSRAIGLLKSEAPCVTIVGETGTGKSFLANRIGKRKVFDYLMGGSWWSGLVKALDAGKRVVVCMDVHPSQCDRLPEHVRSRLVAAPVAKLGHFTFTMKRAMVSAEGFPKWVEDVLVSHVDGGARELSGAIHAVKAQDEIPTSTIEALRVLGRFVVDGRKEYAFKDIASAVSEVYNLSPVILATGGKRHYISEARKALWWTAHRLCPRLTLAEIGEKTAELGNRERPFDHSSVLNGVNVAEKNGLVNSNRFIEVLTYLGAE